MRGTHRGIRGLGALLGVTGVVLVGAPSASAATQTFDFTAAAQQWVVPANVTKATFDLYGASGGTSALGAPGKGGRATATITVTPGATIQIFVGGMGQSNGTGGFNGGGTGGGLGGGGGASDIRVGGAGFADRVLVAGGGGGAGGCSGMDGVATGGDGGGENGTAASGCQAGFGGGGGTQNGGGTATAPATPGESGVGGNHGTFGTSNGGAGGGGWYGGGGARDNAAGGGGSGYGPAGTAFETGVRTGDGEVTVTYEPDPVTPTKPDCGKLRKKLKRQKAGHAKAKTSAKRKLIGRNIKDTKRRLRKRGC